MCAVQLVQCGFGPVEQAGFQKILRQGVLRPIAVGLAQIGTGQQVLVNPDSALVFAAAAKQVAQREVQFRRVRISLNRFDERVDGLILLLVQQVIEAFEVGFGRLAIFDAELAQIQARCEFIACSVLSRSPGRT